MKLPARPWDKPKRHASRATAVALVAIRAECDGSKRLSLMPMFGGFHGSDHARPGWFLVIESLHPEHSCGVVVSPRRLSEMRRAGMLCPVGEGGDAVTVYDVDIQAVAHALGAA